MRNEKSVALFIATEKGYYVLEKLLEQNVHVDLVFSFREVGVKRDFSFDIEKLCRTKGIDFYLWKDSRNVLEGLIQQKNIEIAFSIGWKFLIPETVINRIEYKLVVLHDSLLPKYRGFAPTPTAIICGDEELGVTALIASDKVDAGRVLLQKKYLLQKSQNIADAIQILDKLYFEMIFEIILHTEQIYASSYEQNESEATYSIWRDDMDYTIDWFFSADSILNLVRALSYPYMGACSKYKGKVIRIEKASVFDDLKFAIRQPGKIWEIKDNAPVVVCGSGLLRIEKAMYDDGETVVFDSLRQRLG